MEKTYEFKTQFGARLTQDEADYLNENKDSLIPEIDGDVSGKAVLLFMAEKAISKVAASKKSLQSDIDLIDKLQKQVTELLEIQDKNRLALDQASKEKEDLIIDLRTCGENYEETLKHKEAQTFELQQALISRNLTENQILISLTPLEYAVTKLIQERTEERAKTPISMRDVIFSAFWLYYVTQEWEFSKLPLLVSKRELKELVRTIPAE
jgi:hypothetical protein